MTWKHAVTLSIIIGNTSNVSYGYLVLELLSPLSLELVFPRLPLPLVGSAPCLGGCTGGARPTVVICLHMYVRMCAWVHTCVCAVRVPISVNVCICVSVYVCVCVCVCVCMCQLSSSVLRVCYTCDQVCYKCVTSVLQECHKCGARPAVIVCGGGEIWKN
jgi:hypothetical protein